MQFTLTITTIRLGRRYVSLAEVGGSKIRGDSGQTYPAAVRNLLWTLSGNGPKNEDADIGLELALAGTDMETEIRRNLPALGDGQENAPSDPFAESETDG